AVRVRLCQRRQDARALSRGLDREHAKAPRPVPRQIRVLRVPGRPLVRGALRVRREPRRVASNDSVLARVDVTGAPPARTCATSWPHPRALGPARAPPAQRTRPRAPPRDVLTHARAPGRNAMITPTTHRRPTRREFALGTL